MATVNTNDLKNGQVIKIDGNLWQVIWFQHHKPGKGGAVVRSKLRNVNTGAVVERTLPAGADMELAIVEKREMQYLYHDGTHYVFMDTGTYDQISLSEGDLGDTKNYLKEQQTAAVVTHEGRPLSVELPASVELEVSQTDPGLKGDRVSGATKPATLETGVTIQVPLFVEIGEVVRVDTRTGEYLTRVS